MKICAYNVSIKDAFTGVLSVVAATVQYFAERFVAANVSPSAVVFETDDLIRQRISPSIRQCIRQSTGQCVRKRFISEDDIGNQPGRSLFCIEIH